MILSMLAESLPILCLLNVLVLGYTIELPKDQSFYGYLILPSSIAMNFYCQYDFFSAVIAFEFI